MDESARVLHRLERIGALEETGAPRSRLLDELRALVCEAETWTRLGADRPPDELAGTSGEVEGMS
jgi:hypothetical protein